jgi:PD-(D/E)XK nuclease superfamily protein
MKPLILSPHSLSYLTCQRKFYNYRILGRRLAGARAGADAGNILHTGWAVWNRGVTQPNEVTGIDAIIERERAALPLERPDDHRTAAYLKDAFAALRAELEPRRGDWRVLEVERRLVRPIGEVADAHPHWRARLGGIDGYAEGPVPIHLELVRDLVIEIIATWERWVVDLKTSGRDDEAKPRAWAVGDQGKCYCFMWNDEFPDKPVAGAQFIRLVMRKPVLKPSAKTKPTFEPQVLPPFRYTPAILEEWRRSVMTRAADILRRDPENPDDWPMQACDSNCIQFNKPCDYLGACEMDPDKRAYFLAQDFFEASNAGKEPLTTEEAV